MKRKTETMGTHWRKIEKDTRRRYKWLCHMIACRYG
jgi:hypothetical protein